MKEYKNYYDNGQLFRHYGRNEKGKLEGEYKQWWNNGQIWRHCFYKDGYWDGEYKNWYSNGQLTEHYFYHNRKIVDITEYVEDVNNITESEYFHLQLTFGYFPILKYNEKP